VNGQNTIILIVGNGFTRTAVAKLLIKKGNDLIIFLPNLEEAASVILSFYLTRRSALKYGHKRTYPGTSREDLP
jgi:hypothetical protein